MRLLHTSDWHLGRETYRVPRRPDHEAVIEEIVGVAREERPDLVVHSGDLFDAPRPGYEDLSLGADALARLADLAPVVVVCGNHDSPALFRLYAQLLGPSSRIHLVEVPRLPEAGGVLEFEGPRGERARIAALPFIHANRLVPGFEDPSKRTVLYADRVAAIESMYAEALAQGYDASRDVLLFAAHLYVGGATYGRSERALHVSEMYASRGEALPPVSYAALGHIHQPQALAGGVPARYAGSPLQLDFGEEGEEKTIVLVEARPGQPARIEPRPLSAGRRLLRLAGTLEELGPLAADAAGRLVHVTVRSEDPVTDAEDRVRALLPDAVILEVAEEVASRRLSVVADAGPAEVERGIPELFEAYLAKAGTRGAPADRVLRTFAALLEAVEDNVPPVLDGTSALVDEPQAEQAEEVPA